MRVGKKKVKHNLFKPKMITSEILEKLKYILDSGWVGLGGVTKEFEDAFSQYVGCNFSIAVNSATSALHLALICAEINEGDEVITTPMSFVSTNHVILYQKAVPVFCDINSDTLNIDINKVEKLITNKTKAIMLVHYGGCPYEHIDVLRNIAEKYNLWIIEDAAHATGARYTKGDNIGSNSKYERNLTCFSFHAVKNLPTADGGMITTNSYEIDKRLRKLRWLGIDKDTYNRAGVGNTYKWMYSVDEVGYKYHMNDITATIGLVQLQYLDFHNHHRRTISQMYRDFIDSDKILGFVGEIYNPISGAESACHLCVIKVANRDSLIGLMNNNGIYPGVHYYPNHLYPVYKKYYRKLPNAEKVWKDIISLPLHMDVGMWEVKEISGVINGK